MKPLICPIKTTLGYYFYETQRNEIIAVNEEIYERITNWDSVEKMKCSERDEKTECAIKELKEFGYLNEPYIEKLEHPATRFLDIMLERKVSKILLQLTQKCNLRCHYCVYSEEKNLGTRSHSNKNMSYETAKKAIDFYMNHSVDCEEKVVGFYGGEPLLQFDLIKRIIDYCNRTFRGHRILYTITTNGTLLTDEIIDFLVKNRVSITVSLDGPKEIHDKNRKYINNEGSYDTVIENFKKLKAKCNDEKQCSVNMVIDTDNEYKKISDFFNEPIIKNIRVRWNMVEEDNNVKTVNEQFISNFEYQTFLGYVRYFRGKNFVAPDGLVQEEFEDRTIVDSHFNPYFLPNITAPGGPCIPGKMRLMVDCDGKLFPCERISETSICTNIGSLEEGFDNEKIKRLLNIAQLTEECKNCWAFTLCSVCAKHAVNEDRLCVESKRKRCTGSRGRTWNQLMDRILLYENRIHERKMNKIKEGVF